MIWFSIEDRKKITQKLSELIEKILFPITKNNEYSGAIVAFCHYLFIVAITFMILSKEPLFFILGALAWIGIFVGHIFFKGCIFIRIERHLWKKDEWYGPWGVPLYILEKLLKITNKNTPNLLEKMYYSFFLIIIGIIVYRGYNLINKKYDKLKTISHKESRLVLPPTDSEYPLPKSGQRFLGISEQPSKYTAL